MCTICDYMADQDPTEIKPETVLNMVAERMKTAKGKALDHLTELVDTVIGFKEPENQETPVGLTPGSKS